MDAVIPPIPVKFGKNPFPVQEKANSPPKTDGHNPKSNKQNIRTRVFSIVTYLQDEQIMRTLSFHQEQIRYNCFILHDRDLKDDGTPKEPHYHVVVETYNAYRVGSVARWFPNQDELGNHVNTFAEAVEYRKECIDYLTHENRKDKAQYSRDDIVNYTEALLIAKEKPRTDDDKALLIIDDMIAGVPEYQLCRRYGREYIINAHRYRDMIYNILDDNSLPIVGRELKNELLRKYYSWRTK